MVILAVFGFYGQAQNTSLDGFLKSNWGQSMAEVKANNLPKGYEYFADTGDDLLPVTDGNFAGVSNCMIIWMFTGDKLFQGVVVIDPELSAKAMSEYDSMKDKINSKYGVGNTYETYDYPYDEGDGHWETAFKIGKGHLSTYWSFDDGNSLSMELTEELKIRITYQSTELVSEKIKQQNATNNDDL